jgi:hypothetical protein
MKTVRVAVACRNAADKVAMPIFTVTVTPDEYDTGGHYEKAEALADAEGYEAPFVCYDDTEYGVLLAAVQELGIVG